MRCLALLCLLVSCGTSSEGRLAGAKFNDECKSTDFSCVVSGLTEPLALGGTVTLQTSVELPGIAGSALSTEAVLDSVLDVNGDLVFGKSEGLSALLLRSGDHVIDFLHVQVLEPTELTVFQHSADFSASPINDVIQLLPGDELNLSYRAKAGSQFLVGDAQDTWMVTGDSVYVLRNGNPGRRRVVAKQAGTTIVEVEAFGKVKTIEIEVL